MGLCGWLLLLLVALDLAETSFHSPFFAPDPAPTLRTGIAAMTAMALDLLAPPGE